MEREIQACCFLFSFEYPQTLLLSLQNISGFLTIFFPRTRWYLCCFSGFSSTLEQRWISPMKCPTYPLASVSKDLRHVWEKSMAITQMQEGRSFQELTPSETQQKRGDDEGTQLNFQGKFIDKKKVSDSEYNLARDHISRWKYTRCHKQQEEELFREKEKMLVLRKTMPQKTFSISSSTCCLSARSRKSDYSKSLKSGLLKWKEAGMKCQPAPSVPHSALLRNAWCFLTG